MTYESGNTEGPSGTCGLPAHLDHGLGTLELLDLLGQDLFLAK